MNNVHEQCNMCIKGITLVWYIFVASGVGCVFMYELVVDLVRLCYGFVC